MTCDNKDDTVEHDQDVRTCKRCLSTFCGPCREDMAVLADHCPICNESISKSDSCRVSGCGT